MIAVGAVCQSTDHNGASAWWTSSSTRPAAVEASAADDPRGERPLPQPAQLISEQAAGDADGQPGERQYARRML